MPISRTHRLREGASMIPALEAVDRLLLAGLKTPKGLVVLR